MRRSLIIFTSLIVALVLSAKPAAAQQDAPPVDAQITQAFISLDKTTRPDRKKFYVLLGEKGDARVVPALLAYKDGTLLKLEQGLAIYGERRDIPGLGSVLPLVGAFDLKPIADENGQPIYNTRPDLTHAIKAPLLPEKRTINELVLALSINDPDPVRRSAALLAAADRADEQLLPAIEKQLSTSDGAVRPIVEEAIASIQLVHGTHAEKLTATEVLGSTGRVRARSRLETAAAALGNDASTSDGLAVAIQKQIARINSYQNWLTFLQNTFYGLSTGSILVLLALGLSIIFGLMGVINMAQGEFMMIGAFTTFVVSEFFKTHFSGGFDYYLLVAIPSAFVVSALVGLICELLVIRHLYGRPLETLLATWGIGLILIQCARVKFGDNQSVSPPTWLDGGIEVMPDLTLPLNRLFIIGYCAACIVGVYLIISKTRLGLLLRATTQNREMAAASGVPTRRIDAMTFAFGAGLAGLAGVVVPLYNKINPSVGREYVIDSFMVVVVGGVGAIAGAIWAGLGLGFISKYLELGLQNIPAFASSASVLGKVFVLGMIIAFLQWRPAGLFPPRGRLADG